MTNKFLLILLFCCNGIVNAQNSYYNQSGKFLKANSHWIFGDKAGIDFNVRSPVGITSSISGYEGSAAASHPETGKLLFYSNGAKCWKADGQLMANGDSLLGNGEGGATATQGVCIVPFINDTNKYYLFSLSDYANPNSLYYSVVDKGLDNGQGGIDPARKNILLNATSLSEAMIAIPGECNDVWLLVHSYRDPEFYAYHITSKGIDTLPVVSKAGNAVTGGLLATYSRMAASPDRRKIALNGKYISNNIVSLAEFSPATGIVSNQIDVKNVTTAEVGHGICFSPDNTKLYVATVGIILFAAKPDRLYQFDISNFDSAAIARSRYAVYETNNADYDQGADLRMYAGMIFMCTQGTGSQPKDHINRIDKPNVSGAGCDYKEDVVTLAAGTRSWTTFGNDVVYPINVDTIYHHQLQADTAFCTGSSVILKAPSAYGSYLWSNGSANSTLEATEAGAYWVSYRDSCYNLYIDTYMVKELLLVPVVISADSTMLKTNASYAAYQWLLDGAAIPGATDSAYTATENGNYQVIVSNGLGCSDTSAIYFIDKIAGIGSSTGIAATLNIYPNPASDQVWIKSPFPVNVQIRTLRGESVHTYKDVTSFSAKHLARGMYFVTLTDGTGRVLSVVKLITAGN